MTRPSGCRRAGFSLIELLLVISIIALLMGLLLAAVQKVRETGPKVETTARITAINSAIGTYKSALSAKYIPAGQVDLIPTLPNGSANPTYLRVIGPFRLMSQYPAPLPNATANDLNTNCFEAQYIASLFNRASPSNFGGSYGSGSTPVYLNANQTLLFFLNGVQTPNGTGQTGFTGFSNNPQAPFAAATTGEARKGPYLELKPNQYSIGTTAQTVATPSGAAAGGTVNPPLYSTTFAQMVDAYGTPLVYIAAYNAKPGYFGGWNPVLVPVPTPSAVVNLPWYQNGGTDLNPGGWQLISAGKDKIFGKTGNWASAVTDPTSKDDLANFSTTFLGAGPN